jgi:hypothetical protein
MICDCNRNQIYNYRKKAVPSLDRNNINGEKARAFPFLNFLKHIIRN